MVANALKQQIVLKSPPTSVDARGQITGAYTAVKTVRASVQQLSATEQSVAESLAASARWKVVIRYDSSLSLAETWRITWGSLDLEIGSIHNQNQS